MVLNLHLLTRITNQYIDHFDNVAKLEMQTDSVTGPPKNQSASQMWNMINRM